MTRRKTTLKCKSGGVQNGNGAGHPRTLIDLATYREHHNVVNSSGHATGAAHWDPTYSGWSNPSRPRNYAISLRAFTPLD